MDILVQLTDVPAGVLEYVLRKGYYKTKAEAVRAALINMGKDYDILDKEDFLLGGKLEQLEAKRKAGKLKFETLAQAKARYKR